MTSSQSSEQAARPRRTFLLPILVFVLIVPILLGGGAAVRSVLKSSFDNSDSRRAARSYNFRLLKDQLDEETGVRGYTSIPDRVYLDPYAKALADFPAAARALDAKLSFLKLPGSSNDLADAAATNARWLRTVATPLLALPNRSQSERLQRRGKDLVDRFRADSERIDAALVSLEQRDNVATARAIDSVTLLVLTTVILVVLMAGASNVAQNRLVLRLEAARRRSEAQARANLELRTAFETEKRIADTLQSAFAQRPLPVVPTLSFSATYIPATDETKVGGDWYDAVELPKGRVLFSLGDVEGHGIEAAVNMNRARQALIAAALADPDPAQVLARVNGQLLFTGRMATAVVGYADASSYEFVYATAGHPPPLLLEPGRTPRLLDCGGLPLGVLDDRAYRTRRVQTVPGSVLVLYTDGAVEHSRNVIEGEALLMQAAAAALEKNANDLAATIRSEIFGRRPVGDDVAILTIGFAAGETTRMTFVSEGAKGAVTSSAPGNGGNPPDPANLAAAA